MHQNLNSWSSKSVEGKTAQKYPKYLSVLLTSSAIFFSLPFFPSCFASPRLSTPSRLSSYVWPSSREDCQQQVKDHDPPHKDSLPISCRQRELSFNLKQRLGKQGWGGVGGVSHQQRPEDFKKLAKGMPSIENSNSASPVIKRREELIWKH